MRHLLREGFDRRYVLLPLLAAVALVVSAFFVAEARRGYTQELSDQIRDRQDALREIAELVYATLEAESAQRGYLLTGERQYAEPYEAARAKAAQTFDSLVAHYAISDPAEAAQLEGIRTRLDIKFGETEETLTLMRDGKPREALAAVKTDVGLRYMREVREELEALRERERARLETTLQEWNRGLLVTTAINAASAVFTVVLLVFTGLLASSEIRRRSAAAAELEHLVDQRTAEIRDLSTHMVRLGEREKSSLARELHDELGGLLVAMRMDLAQLRRRIALPDADAEARWKRIDAAIASGVELKRRVIEELRPTLLDNMGLVAALRWQSEQSCAQGGLALDLDLPDDDDALTSLQGDAPIAIFRCVQEALANVLKHARATRVRLALHVEGGLLRVVIEDDGIGLPADALRRVGSHGLKQMRFRMQAVGGEMLTAAIPPHGTRTMLTLRL